MLTQFNHKVISSFLMAVDHQLLDKGSGFTNTTGFLTYATGNTYGLNMYSTPFKQLVNDISISGANVMSGVWQSGIFTMPGQSGLSSLNIMEGQAYFTGRPPLVSGQFSVKDFSIYLTTEPEERILFETKYFLRNEVQQTPTGLFQNAQTYPVIYLKPSYQEPRPFALGGIDNRIIRIRAIVLADSEFAMEGAVDILQNMAHKYFKIIEPSGLPFDALGGFSGSNYNYTGLAAQATNSTYVYSVKSTLLMGVRQFGEVNPKSFPAFVDFELWNFL